MFALCTGRRAQGRRGKASSPSLSSETRTGPKPSPPPAAEPPPALEPSEEPTENGERTSELPRNVSEQWLQQSRTGVLRRPKRTWTGATEESGSCSRTSSAATAINPAAQGCWGRPEAFLPEGWKRAEWGEWIYYYNRQTGQRSWHHPAGCDEGCEAPTDGRVVAAAAANAVFTPGSSRTGSRGAVDQRLAGTSSSWTVPSGTCSRSSSGSATPNMYYYKACWHHATAAGVAAHPTLSVATDGSPLSIAATESSAGQPTPCAPRRQRTDGISRRPTSASASTTARRRAPPASSPAPWRAGGLLGQQQAQQPPAAGTTMMPKVVAAGDADSRGGGGGGGGQAGTSARSTMAICAPPPWMASPQRHGGAGAAAGTRRSIAKMLAQLDREQRQQSQQEEPVQPPPPPPPPQHHHHHQRSESSVGVVGPDLDVESPAPMMTTHPTAPTPPRPPRRGDDPRRHHPSQPHHPRRRQSQPRLPPTRRARRVSISESVSSQSSRAVSMPDEPLAPPPWELAAAAAPQQKPVPPPPSLARATPPPLPGRRDPPRSSMIVRPTMRSSSPGRSATPPRGATGRATIAI
jgi:hypothetical protein